MPAGTLSLGILLPHAGRAASPAALREVAREAEEMGWDSVWVGDHIVLPRSQESLYPYRAADDDGQYEVPSEAPFLEAFETLAFVAAHTERIKLVLSVGILPYRHPLLWAKAIGTLDYLSEGRFILGAGVGWLEEEFRALDADFPGRGRAADRALALLRELWSHPERPVDFEGSSVHVVPSHAGTPPPVWIGGSGPRARQRVIAFGDAWHPHVRSASPETVRTERALLEEQAGRAMGVALLVPAEITDDDADRPPPWESGVLTGSPRRCAEMLAAYRASGADHVLLSLGGGARRRLRNGERLLSALRELDGVAR